MRKQNLVLGVTGSIAAVKAQGLIGALQHKNFNVKVAMSYSATQVVGEVALSAVSGERPYSHMWNDSKKGGEPHIELAAWADVMLIAPATASCMGALYSGQFDNAVTLVAANVPYDRLFLAPAMSSAMWNNPATLRNRRFLSDHGVRFLGPVQGRVASGAVGERLMEPSDIAAEINTQLKG